MQKIHLGLIVIILISTFSIAAYGEKYKNFDSTIQEFLWDYTRLDSSLVFSVHVRNLLDPGNYIVHIEILPEKNQFFNDDTRLLDIETGYVDLAFFEYPINTIDNLSIKTWVNPPETSGNPDHVFDEKVYHISKEEMWQKIIDRVNGVQLSYDVTLNEDSDLDIKIYHTPTIAEPKGIRVLYSGSSEICTSFTFKMNNKPIGSFSGDRFFDRTVNLGGLENPDFHIICKILDNKASIINIPDLQNIFENDLYAAEVPQCFNSFCIFGFTVNVGSEENIVLIILSIVGATITLVTVIFKTRK